MDEPRNNSESSGKHASLPATPRELLLLAIALIALRLPLWTLPGLGRDEATYVLWSHHLQPAYAPLLQFVLVVLDGLGADAPWSWRIPSMLSGFAVLVCFDGWMRARGAHARARWIGVLFLALSPWQTYAGSILHPDDLQLTAIFGFAWAARSGKPRLALLAAAIAPWTKPSGFLVTCVAVLWATRQRLPQRHRFALTSAAFVAGALPFAFAHSGWFPALMSFGQVGAQSSLLDRLLLLVLGVVFLAGPGALLPAARGAFAARRLDLRCAPDHFLAFALLGVFTLAALLSGQVKGNWLLPGLFLLWPLHRDADGRRGARGGRALAIAASLLISTALSFVFARPELARRADQRWGERVLPAYLSVAGAREAEVASATRWWHRPAEYRSLRSWCEAAWPSDPIAAVVSDDYGLAAQWAVQCPTRVPRLVLPLDLLLAVPDAAPAGALVLAVRCTVEDLVGVSGWLALAPLRHPITGQQVHRALLLEEIPLRPIASK